MIDKTIKVSATGRAMLMQAATRGDRLVPPPKLPTAAARQVVRSLINNGLLEEVAATADDPAFVWRTGEDGVTLELRATDAGINAVSEASDGGNGQTPDDWSNRIEPASPALLALIEQVEMDEQEGEQAMECCDDVVAARRATRRPGLQRAAEAVLATWVVLDGQAVPEPLLAPLQALRTALRPTTSPRPVGEPREDTKQARVLAMLRSPEGTTVAQIAEAMAWQPHTVRAFFAGLGKKGMAVEVMDRVRQVGPNRTGAKGSYSIYRLADEAGS